MSTSTIKYNQVVLHNDGATSHTIPTAAITTSEIWEITSFSAFYTATATAGNRLPALSITLPGTLYPLYLWTLPYNVAASQKISISGGPASPITWPRDQSSITISPANPAASSLTQTLSANYAHQVQSLRFTYTTDSTAGTRLVEVQFQDAAGNIVGETFISTQLASLAYVYAFSRGLSANAQASSSHMIGSLPDIDIQPSGKIKIQDVNGIASTDRVTNIQIADLTTPSVLAAPAVGFAPLPLPTPLRLPIGTIITLYDANNIDANDTVSIYITGSK